MNDSIVDVALLGILVTFFLVVAVGICHEPGPRKSRSRVYTAWRLMINRWRRAAHRDERWITLRELEARRLRGDR
jgi:hypothetical protein